LFPPKACSSLSKLLLVKEIHAWLVSLYLVFKEQTPIWGNFAG
jgi:hypothetical protein